MEPSRGPNNHSQVLQLCLHLRSLLQDKARLSSRPWLDRLSPKASSVGASLLVVLTVLHDTPTDILLQPIFRRVITRAIGLVPSMAVAIAAGRGGVDTLLVASQVALSIVLPFIVFPLLYLTCSKSIMTVRKPPPSPEPKHDVGPAETVVETLADDDAGAAAARERDLEGAVETVDYANPKIVAAFGWLLWIVVVAANVYAIVTLGLGET